jgi:hypothetical protein
MNFVADWLRLGLNTTPNIANSGKKSMQLQTTLNIPQAGFSIGHDDPILLLGSCFADEMGSKLTENGFSVLSNPFGTLYNPASLAALLLRSVSERETTELFHADDGLWHSWMHHSRFSSPDKEELRQRISQATEQTARFLRTARVLIVTFGTAIIYRLKADGMLVANCHKQPDTLFRRERMSAYDIVDQWTMVLQLLHAVNPDLQVIFTVSPVRHKRDGMHVNQISKGILLVAVDELVERVKADLRVDYFPAYEILLDELRDYRFYADDMVHPSSLAVEYIWQRFQETFMTAQTVEQCRQNRKAWLRQQHREIIR